jgi:hypothetical protein
MRARKQDIMTTTTVAYPKLTVADLIDALNLVEDDARETYSDSEASNERRPTEDGFREWLIGQARTRFLANLLFGSAIYNDGYGGLTTLESCYDDSNPAATSAVLTDDDGTYTVTLDTISKGLDVIRNAVPKPVTSRNGSVEDLLHNAETGERLYMSKMLRASILGAEEILDAAGDGEHEDIDVISMLAVLECGLFGRVIY